jgi:uncharacterized membrane protein
MKLLKLRRLVSLVTCFSLALQSFVPLTLALPVYAEDIASESVIVEQSPTQETTSEVTPDQNPETTPEPTIVPETTPETSPESTPAETNDDPSQSDEQQPSSIDSTSSEPETSPTMSLSEQYTVVAQLGQSTISEVSPTLTTDKPDYFPTDTVYITGINFLPNTTYTLRITSLDNPVFIYNPTVTSDENGNISFSFTLDGNYRPNYTIEATDTNGSIVASYDFTDAATGTLYPDGQGFYNQWNGDESDVDENGTPRCGESDGNDNIASNHNGNRESVKINLSSIPNNSTVTSVRIYVTDRASGSIGGTYKTFVRVGSTNTDASYNLATTSFSGCTARDQIIDIPDFVKKNDTNLEIGVLKVGNTNVRIGTIRVVVSYTEIQHVEVRVCHASGASGNYQNLTVDDDSVVGATGHGGHSNDIIPPFSYYGGYYPGLNWDTQGQAIWENNCVVPAVSYTVDTYSSNTYSTPKDDFITGQTVYGKGTRSTAANMRLRYIDSNGSVAKTCNYTNSSSVTCDYSLPSNAPLGTWKIQVGRCDNNCSNSNNWVYFGYAEDTFTVSKPTGSIKVCKMIIDGERNIVNGSEMGSSTFTIDWNKGLADTVFTSGFTPNTKLLASSESDDAYCITYSGLAIDNYTYSQEVISGSTGWQTALYNDQYTEIVNSLNDFYTYGADTNSNGEINLALDAGPNRTLVILNQYVLGSIHGFKWSDINGDGMRQTCDQSLERVVEGDYVCTPEPLLSDWTINLYKLTESDEGTTKELFDTKVTDSGDKHFGWYWFEGLLPGQYEVCEELKSGWAQTFPNPACHQVNLPDQNSSRFIISKNAVVGPEYNFGNKQVDARLLISRSNNATSPLSPGSSVEHTITIKVLDNNVRNLKLTDLLPNGFSFSGSYSVMKGSAPVTLASDPEYHSPGVWNLGDYEKDDTITIKYTASITSDINPGIYSDLAWAVADDAYDQGLSFLALGENSEYVNENNVGTDVEVIKDQTNGGTYDVEKKVEGEVLGASTSLPATGASPAWSMLALVCLVYGIRFIKSSNKK